MNVIFSLMLFTHVFFYCYSHGNKTQLAILTTKTIQFAMILTTINIYYHFYLFN